MKFLHITYLIIQVIKMEFKGQNSDVEMITDDEAVRTSAAIRTGPTFSSGHEGRGDRLTGWRFSPTGPSQSPGVLLGSQRRTSSACPVFRHGTNSEQRSGDGDNAEQVIESSCRSTDWSNAAGHMQIKLNGTAGPCVPRFPSWH